MTTRNSADNNEKISYKYGCCCWKRAKDYKSLSSSYVVLSETIYNSLTPKFISLFYSPTPKFILPFYSLTPKFILLFYGPTPKFKYDCMINVLKIRGFCLVVIFGHTNCNFLVGMSRVVILVFYNFVL